MDSYKKVIAILKNTQDKTQNTILNIKYNIKKFTAKKFLEMIEMVIKVGLFLGKLGDLNMD